MRVNHKKKYQRVEIWVRVYVEEKKKMDLEDDAREFRVRDAHGPVDAIQLSVRFQRGGGEHGDPAALAGSAGLVQEGEDAGGVVAGGDSVRVAEAYPGEDDVCVRGEGDGTFLDDLEGGAVHQGVRERLGVGGGNGGAMDEKDKLVAARHADNLLAQVPHIRLHPAPGE
jgi:hypothetical protein